MIEIKKYNLHEVQEMYERYTKANYEYYRTGDSIMSDLEFDNLKEVLELNGYDFTYEEAEPETDEVKEKLVGSSGMGSLVKTQVFDDKGLQNEHMNKIANWLKQSNPNISVNTKILVGWKLDGNAIKIIWDLKTKKIVDAITRGNFSIKNKFIDILNKQLKFSGIEETRCEAVMSKSKFIEKYQEQDYANPRNLVAGILNDRNINDERKNDVIFVPLNDGCSPCNQSNELFYDEIELKQLPELYFSYLKRRNDFIYPNDGMVIYLKDVSELQMKGKYPLHSIAVKFPPVKVNAVIKDIEWNLKKSGSYIPKLILEPVDLDGTTQRKVAAFNYNYIMENKLFPGAIIEIGKNGDIIAYMQRVIVEGDIKNMKPLPTDSKVVDIHLMVDGEEAQKIADTERFIVGCYTLGIKNFGYAWFKQIAKLCDNNIINLFNKEIINIGSLNLTFGGSKKQIEFIKKIESLQLNYFNVIMMLQFERCGYTTSLQLANYFSDIDYDFGGLEKDVINSFNKNEINYNKFHDSINTLKSYNYDIHKMKSDNHVYDATFEMTGSPKPYFNTKDEFIKSVPNWKHTSLKAGTTYLITDKPTSTTGKMAKARKLGIEILTYEEATLLYKQLNQK